MTPRGAKQTNPSSLREPRDWGRVPAASSLCDPQYSGPEDGSSIRLRPCVVDRLADSFPSPWPFTTFPASEFAHTFTADSFYSIGSLLYYPACISKTEPPLSFKRSLGAEDEGNESTLSTSSRRGRGDESRPGQAACGVWVSVLSRTVDKALRTRQVVKSARQ